MFTIRNATEADNDLAVKVVKEVFDEYNFGWFPDDYHSDLYDLQSYYLSKSNYFWIAEDDSLNPIGTVALELLGEPLLGSDGISQIDGYERIAGADCALNRLYVIRSGRGQGVGTALIDIVIKEAKKLGRKRIELWSDKRFENAHRLYESLGAVIVGERICHDPEQSPEWGLKLDI